MTDDQFNEILDNIHGQEETDANVQFLVYHVAAKSQETFDELTRRFDDRVALERTIVIISGENLAKDDEPKFLYCNVSRDLVDSYNRHAIINKIAAAYKQVRVSNTGLTSSGGGAKDAVRSTFGQNFIDLIGDNNMLN